MKTFGSWRRGALALAALWLAAGPVAAPAAAQTAELEALREADLRLAGTFGQLVTANAALCATTMPWSGLVVHTLGQYAREVRPAARQVFGFERPVAVEAVVPGSPAAAAGVLANDAIVAINGEPVPGEAADGPASSALRDTVERRLAALPPGAAITLRVMRTGETRDLTVVPRPACRSRFEVVPGTGQFAQTDGETIQIATGGLEGLSPEGEMVRLAHELSHIVMRHRVRLEAAGVSKGMLSEFGRNLRLNRQAESEADLLSVHLLYNAGADPLIAAQFWEGDGKRFSYGIFRHRAYPSASRRAAALRAEAARIPPGAERPWTPPLVATRDAPLK
jgi:Zn-dependent protease with chaperone function